MILPYLLRLICLCFAAFFLIYVGLGWMANLLAPTAIRVSKRMRPREAARFLFAFRIFPFVLAVSVVLGLCAPSYFWLEPDAATERVGFVCSVAAILGAATSVLSVRRALQAIFSSRQYVRYCERVGQEVRIPESPYPALIIPEEVPLLALAGLIHPRLVISRRLLRTLLKDELEAAMGHERAHRISHDNFKRLFLVLVRNVIPFIRGFTEIERHWSRLTEWAADDQAAGGDSRRALALAAALVHGARLGGGPRLPVLLSSLQAGDDDLSIRVDRLLHPARRSEKSSKWMHTACLIGISLATVMFWPATLASVHRLLEHLIR